MEKKLSDYIFLLEKLFIDIISNNNEQSISIKNRMIKLINILSSKGISPQEISEVLLLDKPFDNDLEQLKNNFHVEKLPNNLLSEEIYMQFKDEQFINNMKNLFLEKHKELARNGIIFDEDYKFE